MKALLFVFLLLPLHSSPHIKAVEGFQNRKVALFVRSVYCEAKRINTESQIPVSLILGMCALETGYLSSRRAIEDCNYFSIRRNHKYCIYNSFTDSFDDYKKVLNQRCYRNLQPKTLDEWYGALKCCHYFESKTYIKKLDWIILHYKFDTIK